MATENTSKLPSSVLVIGGCGFLGHHIVSQILERRTSTVSVLDLRTTHNRLPNASYHDADITSPDAVRSVLEQVKPAIIIHTASPATVRDGTSNAQKKSAKALYYKVNVEGTRNLIQQAVEIGTVKAFIYTSTASVIHDAVSDLINADERWPVLHPPQQREYYAETKAVAEELVLDANRKHGDMLTCALRPAGIFGEGDMQLIPNMLKAYQKGQTKFQIGSNDNLFDFSYVGNVAHAHVLAAVALMDTHALSPTVPLDHERVDGEAFLITNAQPVCFWDFARMVWSVAGDTTEPGQVWVIEKGLGLILATVIEWGFWLAGGWTPNLDRQKVQYSCMTRYYNIDKARRVLGYAPKWGIEEAVRKTVGWFKERERKGVEKKAQ
ncbi:erg26, C-3 sterol dehydrogenase [Mycoblastus sanguinarius]|nr:erg26, C-3 sterol dehydrogenase [Mycoblastus sanguinarius]